MRLNIISYLITTVIFFGLDFVWISLSKDSVYKAKLGSLMLDKPHLGVAAGFYLLYVVAIIVFAVLPAITQESWVRALWAGALLGFTAYGTYDLTNQATLVGWSSFVTVVDMAWGTFATGVAATAAFFAVRALA